MSQRTANHPSPTYDDLDDWLTPLQARQYLKISRSHLYELIRSERLPAKRWGKRNIRIPKTAVSPLAVASETTRPAA